jgi:hypothetical protein
MLPHSDLNRGGFNQPTPRAGCLNSSLRQATAGEGSKTRGGFKSLGEGQF